MTNFGEDIFSLAFKRGHLVCTDRPTQGGKRGGFPRKSLGMWASASGHVADRAKGAQSYAVNAETCW